VCHGCRSLILGPKVSKKLLTDTGFPQQRGNMNPEKIAEILRDCLNRGFRSPFTVCLVGANGYVLVARYTLGQVQGEEAEMECEILAELPQGPGYTLPMHMLITDTSGEATVVTIELPER
jgi:hypothetical protein